MKYSTIWQKNRFPMKRKKNFSLKDFCMTKQYSKIQSSLAVPFIQHILVNNNCRFMNNKTLNKVNVTGIVTEASVLHLNFNAINNCMTNTTKINRIRITNDTCKSLKQNDSLIQTNYRQTGTLVCRKKS